MAGRGSALSLRARALALLARREHSRTELRRKLLPHARAEALAAAQAAAAAHAAPFGEDGGEGDPGALMIDRPTPGRAAARPGVLSSAAPAAASQGPGGGEGDAPGVDTGAVEASAQAALDELLAWLQDKRYLSEERFAETRVHARAPRFGNLRIRQELAQHGVTLDTEAAQRLRDSEHERCREVRLRKFGGEAPADAAARAKQMRFLAGRGFSADVVRRVLQQAGSELDAEDDAG